MMVTVFYACFDILCHNIVTMGSFRLVDSMSREITIYRVQRASEYIDQTIYPQAYFFRLEDAEEYVEEEQPRVRECPFYRMLEIEEVLVRCVGGGGDELIIII